MRGSITKRGKKSWRLQVFLGKGAGGKPERYFETVTGIKRDAETRLSQLLAEYGKGNAPSRGTLTVADLLHQWVDGRVRTNCAPRTIESYHSTVELHLIPNLGHYQLRHLQPSMIESYYSKACERLSAKSVLYHHRLLKQALKYGCQQGCLGRNPADLVRPPKPRRKPMRTLTQGEVADLLSAASGNYHYPVIYTAVSSGLRQGELLGLRWRDIDIASRSISVNRSLYKRGGKCQFLEPKTGHSRRRVAMTSKLAAFLGEYRLEREHLCHELGKTVTPDDLVFATTEGKALDPSVVTHNFTKIMKRAGLEHVRFHDLRHTFASLMLQRGANPKVISEALGHASVAFTLDIYSHIIEGMQEEAMALLDEVLPAGVNQIRQITPTLSIM